jgi:hypothetical protein
MEIMGCCLSRVVSKRVVFETQRNLPMVAIQKPPDKTTWGALRKEVKKRRKAPVGGFTYQVAFLDGGCFTKWSNPPTTLTIPRTPAPQITQKWYFITAHKQYQPS